MMYTVGQQEHWRRGIRPPLTEHLAADGVIACHGLWHLGTKQAVAAHHIPLPAAPGQAIALLQEKPVADVLITGEIGRLGDSIEHAEGEDSSTIHHFEEEAMVPPSRVSRLQQAEISPPFYLARGGTRRFAEVGDTAMTWMHRIDREADATFEHVIRSGRAKALTAE
jgi:hypothetical protein